MFDWVRTTPESDEGAAHEGPQVAIRENQLWQILDIETLRDELGILEDLHPLAEGPADSQLEDRSELNRALIASTVTCLATEARVVSLSFSIKYRKKRNIHRAQELALWRRLAEFGIDRTRAYQFNSGRSSSISFSAPHEISQTDDLCRRILIEVWGMKDWEEVTAQLLDSDLNRVELSGAGRGS